MTQTAERICDASAMADLIDRMARQLAADLIPGVPLCLVGIRTRGDAIASMLANSLAAHLAERVSVGAVDITLYRDDLGDSPRWPVLHGTDIPFDVAGADVVLVDDVLFTGRTVRAALNTICDLGRPARVRLAVLVDRGHRELPVQPDVVGLKIETTRDEQVIVRVAAIDGLDEVVRARTA